MIIHVIAILHVGSHASHFNVDCFANLSDIAASVTDSNKTYMHSAGVFKLFSTKIKLMF